MESISPPEMQRVPLENVYLQVCASGIQDKPAEFLEKTPDPPDKFSVEFAEDRLLDVFRAAQAALRDLGALDKDQPDGLTPPLGRER